MLDLSVSGFSTVVPEKESESIFVMSNERYSNINQMNTYQADSENQKSESKFIDSVTSVDFNYDYSQVPMNYDTRSFWQELADPVQEAGGYVWDTALGTWTSVKESVVAAGDSVINAVDSAGNALIEGAGSFLDKIKDNLLWLLAVLLIVIVIIAKSGILKQIAPLLKP